MESLPFYVYLVFGLTVLLTLLLFYYATFFYVRGADIEKVFVFLFIWIALQSTFSYMGFYKIVNTVPPKMTLILFPPLIFILVIFNTKKGKQAIDFLNIKTLTIIHIIRIPVEVVLFWLFIHKAVPKSMTFEGRNFDIFSGLSAPIVYYFGFVKRKLNRKIVLVWNFVCLALLLNIVITGVLSAPTAFQKFSFDQPNIAVLNFPFVLLPAFIVPMVLFSHLVSISQLLLNKISQQVI